LSVSEEFISYRPANNCVLV